MVTKRRGIATTHLVSVQEKQLQILEFKGDNLETSFVGSKDESNTISSFYKKEGNKSDIIKFSTFSQ